MKVLFMVGVEMPDGTYPPAKNVVGQPDPETGRDAMDDAKAKAIVAAGEGATVRHIQTLGEIHIG